MWMCPVEVHTFLPKLDSSHRPINDFSNALINVLPYFPNQRIPIKFISLSLHSALPTAHLRRIIPHQQPPPSSTLPPIPRSISFPAAAAIVDPARFAAAPPYLIFSITVRASTFWREIPESAVREKRNGKRKLKQQNSPRSQAPTISENKCVIPRDAKQFSPVLFYGSPHGVPPKGPARLLRLLCEICIDLTEQNKLREDVWATFPRQDDAMKFAKQHGNVRLFSYQII